MAAFTGMLKANEIYGSIYNMIISQLVFGDNIAGVGGDLVDRARVDGGLYGDTKLYYATDVLHSNPWGADAEATKLLELNRPADPKCQAIRLDKFRQIKITLDEYLTKRAWGDADSFAQFTSIMLDWVGQTKRIYDATTYNAFIGTDETDVGAQKKTIDVTAAVGSATGEEAARIKGAAIAQGVADLITDLKDISRDFNDYGFLRSYNIDDLVFVWNSAVVNEVEKRDLPTIYHKDIVEKLGENVLPSRYFGKVNTGATKGKADGTIRSLIEQKIGNKQYFAGDAITDTAAEAPAGTSYTVDNTIAFKVFAKGSVPFMSAFEVGTSFFNPQSLTTNHYLTWGHNTLEHLSNYPMITVRLA